MNRHHNMPPLAERLEIDYASLAQQAQEALTGETLAPIFDDADVATYSERAKSLKGVAAMIEKARKAEKDQALKDGRTIDDFFKTLAKPVTDAADAIVASINAWQTRRLAEERKAQAEREKQEREAAAVFGGDEPEAQAAPVVAKEAARVVSSSGRVVASAGTKWLHEVTDLTAVPRQYLMVNDAAIKAAIAGGARDIPGVRIYETVRTAIR